ncbi:MAG: GDSL-type esterase/lipase family protein [Desulfitobacteriaceae bacterium]
MKVVAIGDSITYGFPYSIDDSWVRLTSNKLNLDIINKGSCGDLTRDMLVRFPQDVLSLNPTHVIIMGGTNDAFCKLSLDEISRNLGKMVKQSLNHNITPILALPIPCEDEIEEGILGSYRNWIRCFTAFKKVSLLDFYSQMLKSNGGIEDQVLIDGVHPSQKGYQLMMKLAVAQLRVFLY